MLIHGEKSASNFFVTNENSNLPEVANNSNVDNAIEQVKICKGIAHAIQKLIIWEQQEFQFLSLLQVP